MSDHELKIRENLFQIRTDPYEGDTLVALLNLKFTTAEEFGLEPKEIKLNSKFKK